MERPILFSGPMVRAILDGRKTMTRRVVKPQPESKPFQVYGEKTGDWFTSNPDYPKHGAMMSGRWKSKYGQPGDRLWVKEAIGCFDGEIPDSYEGRYAADGKVVFHGWQWKRAYLPGMFIPRWAARITLEIVGVRVERLQDIGMDDPHKEGIDRWENYEGGKHISVEQARGRFHALWDSINGKTYPWESNPWVWVIEFTKI